MRSAVDVISALLAAVFVAFAVAMATGIGLAVDSADPTARVEAAPVQAHDH